MLSNSCMHAVILAGGQGSRLVASAPQGSFTPVKTLLESTSESGSRRLIDTVVDAAQAALSSFPDARLVAVAPPIDLPAAVERVREFPPLSGPASAIAAGIYALAEESDEDFVLILAGDLPAPGAAITELLNAAKDGTTAVDGFMAVANGRDQPLLSLINLGAARRAFEGVTGGSVMRAMGTMNLTRVEVDPAPAADIDTWEDAIAHGFGSGAGVEKEATSWLTARQRITSVATRICEERLARAVTKNPEVGDVLAEPALSPMDVPHYDSSAMDGYAVCGTDLSGPWELLDTHVHTAQVRNIHRTGGTLQPGQALPALTGSLIPEGTTAVIRSEHSTVNGSTLELLPGHTITPGADIRRAGEELTQGEVLVDKCTRLTARMLALLGTCGVDSVKALPKLTVDLAFTGNEVITHGVPSPGEVRDAFSSSFPALLEAVGATVNRQDRLPDDPADVQEWLAESTADIVVVTGGSGHSGQDFARQFITQQADVILADSVRCAPGQPTLLTTRTTATGTQLVVGAPGNPLAAHVALHSFVLPAVAVSSGQDFLSTQTCRSSADFPAIRKDRIRLVPARLTAPAIGRSGYALAEPMTRTNSHMLSGYAHADALLVVPHTGLVAGQLATFLPLD